jgi:hypothetical protein
MAFRNPLQWPVGQPRTDRRRKAPFSAGETTIINDLERAVRKLDLQDVEITTNRRVRIDGRLSQGITDGGGDPGVCVYFKRKGQETVLAFDKFNDFWGNLRAVGLYLEYMARLESYDMAEYADRAFTGFKALPEGTITPLPHRDWWIVLGVPQYASPQEVKTAYREMMGAAHPDAGGSQAEFDEVRRAYREWKEA